MRLAWFSPWPPERSGVAGRSAELVPLLAARGHAIDVFVDAARVRPTVAPDEPPAPGATRIISAHDFVWRHGKGHYDLAVYQVGNSHLHRFIWPYLFRYPGLAVVHDARVHHARAEALLSRGRLADYRDEFAWCHPGVDAAAAEFAAMGFDGVYYYQWPMIRGVIECSRLIGLHSAGAVDLLRAEWPGRPFQHIALGEGRDSFGPPDALSVDAEGRAFRVAHGIDPDAIVFGVFGGLTEDKRLPEILDAFHHTRAWVPNARLLLAGAVDPWLDLDDQIRRLGLSDAVHQIASLDDDAFDRAIAAADVTLNLRWPTALETSGPWVRSLALGRATVVLDLPHQVHVPALDPQTWRRREPCDDLAPGADDRAVTVAVHLLDLEQSLRAAMRELGRNARRRHALGAAAREWWRREHTVDRMVADYERACHDALSCPAPASGPDWPQHLRANALAHALRVLDHPAWNAPAVSARLADLAT